MDNLAFLKDNVFEFLLYQPQWFPYLASFSMLIACGLGLPIPEDLTLFTMGYVSYSGITNFKLSVVVCLFGVLVGDSIIYVIGRQYGLRLARRKFMARFLSPERLEGARANFHKYGNRLIFGARFMPGLRAPTYFFAGTMHLPYRVFIAYDGLAALISVPVFTGATYFFGEQIEHAVAVVRRVQNGIAFLILGIVTLFVIKHYYANRNKK